MCPCHRSRLTEEEKYKKEERISTKRFFCGFQVRYLEHSNGSYK